MGLFAVWRISVGIIAFVAQNRFNIHKDGAFTWISETPWIPDVHPLLQAYARWDSGWYLNIVLHNYRFESVEQNASIVFFPLYPLLMEGLGKILNHQYILSGIIISSLSLAGATLFLYFLAKIDLKKTKLAYSSVLYLLLYPYAFFHVAVYTESLFLLTVLGSFYFARKKQWLPAALFAALSSAARPTGLVMFLILFLEYLDQVNFDFKKIKEDILWIFLAPLGIIMYMGFLFTKFGDPFLFMKAQKAWSRETSLSPFKFFDMLSSYFHDFLGIFTEQAPYHLSNGIDFFVFVFFVAASIYVFFKVRKSYGAFMFISIMIPALTQTLVSIGRYAAVLFPIYILAALKLKKQPFNYGVIILLSMLSAFSILMFVNSYWLG